MHERKCDPVTSGKIGYLNLEQYPETHVSIEYNTEMIFVFQKLIYYMSVTFTAILTQGYVVLYFWSSNSDVKAYKSAGCESILSDVSDTIQVKRFMCEAEITY